MLRKFHITITTVLVAMHALVVPWHVVSSHGLLHAHASAEAHVHGDEHAEAEHREHAAAGLAGWFDASGFGTPHQHGVHAHSATDHVFSRTRAEELPAPPVALLPAVAQVLEPVAFLPVEATESPPAKAPSLTTPLLRGPPVC